MSIYGSKYEVLNERVEIECPACERYTVGRVIVRVEDGAILFHCSGCCQKHDAEKIDAAMREKEGAAVSWLVRLRELQAGGLEFDAALAKANDEFGGKN